MTHRTARRAGLLLATLPLALGAAACSNADNDGDSDTFSDDGTIPADGVTGQFESHLSGLGITDATDVSCGELDDEQGATGTCTATIAGQEYEVPVTVAETNETTTTLEFDSSGVPLPGS